MQLFKKIKLKNLLTKALQFKNRRALVFAGAFVVLNNFAFAQLGITAGSTVTENFSTFTSTSLPSRWKAASDNSTARQINTSYGSAQSNVANTLATGNCPNSNGSYRCISASSGTLGTDYCPGFLSGSSVGAHNVNLYVDLKNNASTKLTNITISYSAEKYKNSSNSAGFTIQMFYSRDGSTWTAMGSNFNISFSGDGNSNCPSGSTLGTVPSSTSSVSNQVFNFPDPILQTNTFYFAWNYSVNSGTTYTNGPLIGIDDVTFYANPACSTPSGQVTGFTHGTPTANTIPGISFNGTGTTGYLVCTNPNGYYAHPTNSTTYTIGDIFDAGSGTAWNQTVQEVGPATSGITAATNITSNTQYWFNVYPYNNTNCQGPIYIGVYTTTVGSATTCTEAPTNLTYTAITSTSALISWTAPPGGNVTFTYKIEYKLNSSGTWLTAVASLASGNTSYTLSGLVPSSLYDIRITASNSTCGSSVTNVAAFTTTAGSNSITTNNVSSTYCAGAFLTVNFTASGTFNNGNIYTAQLSNSSGSFGNPTTIGTLSSSNSGSLSINATLPSGSSTGSGYLIRVISNSPAVTGSSTSTFTINALPTATITPTGNTTFCEGGSVTLTSSPGGSYLWSPGGATTQSISATSQGSYTVTVTTNNCSATSGQTTVTVNQAPTAAITPSGATSFCDGGNVTLTANAANNYLWSPGGETTQSITVTDAGNYSVTVTGGNNCQATSTQTTVVVYTLPAAPSISFDATFLSSGSATGNQWYLLGNPTPLGNGQTYTATQGGDYYFIYTDNNGCSVSSDTVNITITGIATMNNNEQVVIYPNPSRGNIVVETTLSVNGNIQLEISNQLGQVVFSTHEYVSRGLYRKNITLNLEQGIYFLRMQTTEGTVAQKIQVLRY